MHILITGGTGLIGRALCHYWIEHGHQLTVWSRRPEQVAVLCGTRVRGVGRLEEIGDEPLDALLLGEHRPVAVAGEGPVDHHVERDFCLANPTHAVRESRRPESILTKQVTLPTTTQHIFRRNSKVLNQNLAVIVTTRHCFDIANNIETLARYVDDETRVCSLW